ncbi:uncharacterized protein LOC132466261 isoform X4 [Gadus macrocephalus]|uniref:uncharacterized protein LOC132466261 isoform X4 n=1 Tax=Gadus macrocephalus TaxID=80720 RepID=UPI0028CB5F01|nr:uncharacterized protein LOC132466261 isoform X4 [Gadus macrocephalus]
MALCSTNSQCSLVRVGWELGSLSSLPLQAIALKVNAGPMFGNALFQLPVEETDHLRSNKSIMDPGVWCPESLWAPGPAPSSLAAKGFRKVQPNLSRRPAAQGNASQSSLPPLSPPAPLRPFTSSPGGRHRGLPLSPSFPPPTTPSSPPSSTSAFGLELRHSRSADHISSDQRSCSPLDHTSTRTRGRDWYRNMYNKIHVVQKADPDSAEAYSSTKGIANKALSSNSPDPGHLPPSPGSGRSSPAAHRDRREDCGRYRAQPRSIFDYEPGASSVLEREQPSLHPSDLSVEDEPWFRFFAELEFGRPPPKKTLDEMLNEDSPVPDTLSSRLSGEDRFIQSPASSSDDYIDWGKSQSSISHSSSCHTANHSPVRSNPTNQGQMWPSAPANSCASPIKSRGGGVHFDDCRTLLSMQHRAHDLQHTDTEPLLPLLRHKEAHNTDGEATTALSSVSTTCIADGWGEEGDGKKERDMNNQRVIAELGNMEEKEMTKTSKLLTKSTTWPEEMNRRVSCQAKDEVRPVEEVDKRGGEEEGCPTSERVYWIEATEGRREEGPQVGGELVRTDVEENKGEEEEERGERQTQRIRRSKEPGAAHVVPPPRSKSVSSFTQGSKHREGQRQSTHTSAGFLNLYRSMHNINRKEVMSGHLPKAVCDIQARILAYKEEMVNDQLNKAEPRMVPLHAGEQGTEHGGAPRAPTVQNRISQFQRLINKSQSMPNLGCRGGGERCARDRVGEEAGHGQGHMPNYKPPKHGPALRLERPGVRALESRRAPEGRSTVIHKPAVLHFLDKKEPSQTNNGPQNCSVVQQFNHNTLLCFDQEHIGKSRHGTSHNVHGDSRHCNETCTDSPPVLYINSRMQDGTHAGHVNYMHHRKHLHSQCSEVRDQYSSLHQTPSRECKVEEGSLALDWLVYNGSSVYSKSEQERISYSSHPPRFSPSNDHKNPLPCRPSPPVPQSPNLCGGIGHQRSDHYQPASLLSPTPYLSQGAPALSKSPIPRAMSPCVMPNSSVPDPCRLTGNPVSTQQARQFFAGLQCKSDGSTAPTEHRRYTSSSQKPAVPTREPINRSRSPLGPLPTHRECGRRSTPCSKVLDSPHPTPGYFAVADSSQPLDPCRAPPVHPDPCRAPRSTSSVFLALERALSGIWEYLREEGEEGEEHEQEEGEEEEGEEDSRGTPLAPERGSSLWAVEHQRTAHSGRGRGPRAGAERTRRAGTNQWELDVGVRCTNSFSNDHTVASYDRQDRREEPGICQEPPKTTFRNSVIPDRKSVAECARVLYNFDAHTSKELSLRKGDVVTITRLVDSNWYEGQLRRAVGIFPVSYVQKICSQPRRPPPPSTPSRSSVLGEAVVRFNFTADTPVELSLCKGEGVVILRKVDQNWYEGCVPGGQRRGIFPVSYVSAPYGQPRWQTPVADSEQRQAFTQEGLQCGGEAFKVLYNYNPHNEDELELTEGDTIDVMEQCDDGWFVDRRPDCGPLRWSHSESTCRLMKRSSDILSTNSTFGRGLSERRQRWRPWKPLTTTTTRPGGPRRREVAPPRVFPVCVLRDGAEAPRLLPHRGRALLPGARLWARSGGPLAHRLTHRRTAGPQAN